MKIADSIISKPHMRHGPAREIYRSAVKNKNNQRKYYEAQEKNNNDNNDHDGSN